MRPREHTFAQNQLMRALQWQAHLMQHQHFPGRGSRFPGQGPDWVQGVRSCSDSEFLVKLETKKSPWLRWTILRILHYLTRTVQRKPCNISEPDLDSTFKKQFRKTQNAIPTNIHVIPLGGPSIVPRVVLHLWIRMLCSTTTPLRTYPKFFFCWLHELRNTEGKYMENV